MTVLATTLAMLIPGPPPPPVIRPDKHRVTFCDHVCRDRQRRHRWWRVVRPHNQHLNAIAACESGGRWHIATGNGFYGGLQFTLSSWRAVGGGGMPHWATPLEQKFRAVRLSWIQGWGAWPRCG